MFSRVKFIYLSCICPFPVYINEVILKAHKISAGLLALKTKCRTNSTQDTQETIHPALSSFCRKRFKALKNFS